MIFSIRSGAASHHDFISPHLRPGHRVQRLWADGDGRDFLPRGTVSHLDNEVIRNDGDSDNYDEIRMTDCPQGGGGGVWNVSHGLHGGVRHGQGAGDDAEEDRDV